MTATLPVFGFLKDRADDVAKSASMLKRVRLSGPFLSAEEPLSKRARSFRRRTTSYLRYALPRKKKLQAAGAMKSAIVDSSRCRKHRRRMHLLLKNHTAADSLVWWLPTHLWHRKRMKMKELWGYCLALRSCSRRGNDRGCPQNALAGLIARGCVVHDASFWRPVALTGSWGSICSLLLLFSDPAEGGEGGLLDSGTAPIAAEGSLMLYTKDAFPQGCYGLASLMLAKSGDSAKVAWLWLHPAIYAPVFAALCAVATDSVQVEHVAQVARFSLRGPATFETLHRVLVGSSGSFYESLFSGKVATALHAWKEGLLLAVDALASNKLRRHDASFVESPSKAVMAPAGPKSFRVPKRVQVSWPADAGASMLFDSSARSDNEAARVPLHVLNAVAQQERRSAMELPPVASGTSSIGAITPPAPTVSTSRVHIVLVKKAGGVDVLLPSAYASRIWCLLVLAGASAVGIEEVDALQHRAGSLSFPRDFPDSKAGADYWQAKRAEQQALDQARPPSKRLGPKHWRVFDFGCSGGDSGGGGGGGGGGFVVPRRRSYMGALLQSDAAQPPMPFVTMLPVRVAVIGRGTVHVGATLFLQGNNQTVVGCVTSGNLRSESGNTHFGIALVLADAYRTAKLQSVCPAPKINFRNPGAEQVLLASLSLVPCYN